MDAFIELLIDWGDWGMLVAAFLAGSFFPFSSEVVMVALNAAGLDAWQLVIYGTVGNVAGGMLNYGLGRMGKDTHRHASRHHQAGGRRVERLLHGCTLPPCFLSQPATSGADCFQSRHHATAHQAQPRLPSRFTQQHVTSERSTQKLTMGKNTISVHLARLF